MLQISLTAARVNAKLTQAEVAKQLGITKQTICNWERGITAPSIRQSQLLSEIYKIPLDNIFFYPGNQI